MNTFYILMMEYPAAQRKHERTAERILDVATTLVMEHGLEGLTITKLAKALAYTPGALFRYFASKDAILSALHVRFVTQLSGRIDQALIDTEQHVDKLSPQAHAVLRLLTVGRTWIQHTREQPGPMALVALSMADPRELLDADVAAEAIEVYVALVARLAELFTAAELCGACSAGNAAHRAVGLGLSIQGILQSRKLSRFTPGLFDADQLAGSISNDLLRAWCHPVPMNEAIAALASL